MVSINLTLEQQNVIHQAIQSGLVRSVQEFINAAQAALSQRHGGFDKEKARLAVARIRELRKGVTLDLQGMSFRDLAHTDHKY